jgi:transcriptional regulator with GAF, ATPase, and Fis domain
MSTYGLQAEPKIELPAVAAKRATVRRTQASLELLNAVSQYLATEDNLGSPWKGILQLTVERMGASSGAILLLDTQGSVIDGTVAYKSSVHDSVAHQLSETAERGLAAWVIANRQGVLVPNTSQDPRWLQRSWDGQPPPSRSAISVPLMTARGVVGVITLTHVDAGYFNDDDLALLTAVSSCISISGAPLASASLGKADNKVGAAQPAEAPAAYKLAEPEPTRLSEAD